MGGSPLQVTIQFLDNGKPFNPLAKEDADTTLSAEERGIGGLGILMVKKSMDAVDYAMRTGRTSSPSKRASEGCGRNGERHMIDFRDPEIGDREWVERSLRASGTRGARL